MRAKRPQPAAVSFQCMDGTMQAAKSAWRWAERAAGGRVRQVLELLCSTGQYHMLRLLALVMGQQDGEIESSSEPVSIQVGTLFVGQRREAL